MAKLIKDFLSKYVLLLILITITLCISVTLHDDIVYADENELPKDTLLVKGATVDIPWEYGYRKLNNWNTYELGKPIDRLGNYDGESGKTVAWTTTVEDFKKCGILTKISLTKTEDGSELASCVASDPTIGIQKNDFPFGSDDLLQLWPGSNFDQWGSINAINFNNIALKDDGSLWNKPPYFRDGTYVEIQGTPAQIMEDTNYDFTVILYFNGSENAPAIPEEVQAVIDAISAIGDVDENNYTDKEKLVTAAKTAYDALESQDLKDRVTNYDKLTAAEESIASFKLAAAKTKAKGELDTLLAGKNEADYDANDWTALTSAISNGKNAIEAATNTDGVTKAQSDAENTVAAIKTKAQKAEEELAAAKTKAKGELDTLLAGKNEADYDANDWTALTSAISNGKNAIEAATNTDGVTKAQSDAENTVAAIKTKAQKAEEELAAAKKYKVAGLKVTSKNRKFTISWGKTKGATGYQVQYRLKGSKKFKTLKSLTKTKMISKKLKLNKKYQFRVRTYTKVDGTKIFGVWTKVKTVKCRGRK